MQKVISLKISRFLDFAVPQLTSCTPRSGPYLVTRKSCCIGLKTVLLKILEFFSMRDEKDDFTHDEI